MELPQEQEELNLLKELQTLGQAALREESQNLGQYMNQVSIFNSNKVTINMTNPNGNLSNVLKLKFKYLKKLRTNVN